MMIENKEILKSFTGSAPVFALPNFVMFPKTAYSFNIFESKYKEMVSDIVETNKLFCVNLKKNNSESEFYNIGTLCYIIESKRLDNGNYTLIASGVSKVRITNINKTKSYNVANLDLIQDNDTVTQEVLKRKKLINKFLSLVGNSNENINLNIIDTSMISTEMLTNLGSLILPLENKDKQKLLELNNIELRLEVLCQFLDSELKVESDLINFNQIIPTNINWN